VSTNSTEQISRRFQEGFQEKCRTCLHCFDLLCNVRNLLHLAEHVSCDEIQPTLVTDIQNNKGSSGSYRKLAEIVRTWHGVAESFRCGNQKSSIADGWQPCTEDSSGVFTMCERRSPRGLGDGSPPVGSRGKAPIRSLGRSPPEADAFLLMNA